MFTNGLASKIISHLNQKNYLLFWGILYDSLFCYLYGKIITQLLNQNNKYLVYPTSFLSGIYLSVALNTGVGYITDFVGENGKSGAFVYGCYGLLDKFFCGFIIYFLLVNFLIRIIPYLQNMTQFTLNTPLC